MERYSRFPAAVVAVDFSSSIGFSHSLFGVSHTTSVELDRQERRKQH
jgi:hypothetical protein